MKDKLKYFKELVINQIDNMMIEEKSKDNDNLNLKGSYFFEEGWLTRLFVSWYVSNPDKFGLDVFPKDKESLSWYSEAGLPSPFRMTQLEGNNQNINDGPTYADCIIGDFKRSPNGKSSILLEKDTKNFVVIEAKTNSSLSRGVSNKDNYSQATRNIACLIHLMYQANIDEEDTSKINFVVITSRGSDKYKEIQFLMDPNVIRQQLNVRIQEFKERITSEKKAIEFEEFISYKDKVIDKILDSVLLLTWEEIIEEIHDQEFKEEFLTFYQKTKIENNIKV